MKGGMQERRLKERRDAGKKNIRKEGRKKIDRQDKRDAG